VAWFPGPHRRESSSDASVEVVWAVVTEPETDQRLVQDSVELGPRTGRRGRPRIEGHGKSRTGERRRAPRVFALRWVGHGAEAPTATCSWSSSPSLRCEGPQAEKVVETGVRAVAGADDERGSTSTATGGAGSSSRHLVAYAQSALRVGRAVTAVLERRVDALWRRSAIDTQRARPDHGTAERRTATVVSATAGHGAGGGQAPRGP